MDNTNVTCDCNSGESFTKCCEPILTKDMLAPSPVRLMRSRYLAFKFGLFDYVNETQINKMSPYEIDDQKQSFINWVKLEVKGSDEIAENGWVEFEAFCVINGKLTSHHEYSLFKKIKGKWLYLGVEGSTTIKPISKDKIEKNKDCPCGSKRKYKRCCFMQKSYQVPYFLV